MLTQIAILVVAVAFAVLVGYVIALLIEVRKSLGELHGMLTQLNGELPSLLKEVRRMTENVNTLTDYAKDGVEHASVFLHAVGEVGETVQQVHGMVLGQGGNVLTKLAGVVAGVKAATAVVKSRLAKSRIEGNGAL
jgi:uncharacterized protein YoxC